MRIALASKKHIANDLDYNTNQIITSLKEFKGRVDLICFGEAFLHGFDALTWDYSKDKNIALSIESIYIDRIIETVKEVGVAVSFGFFEKEDNNIYCSYLFIGSNGDIVNCYRRVSIGWKEYIKTNEFYREGNSFHSFKYLGKIFITCLCGDLWYEDNMELVNAIKKDIILWPLHIDYTIEKWESEEFEAYTNHSNKLNSPVLFINNISKTSHGGCYYFNNGMIINKLDMGRDGYLIINI